MSMFSFNGVRVTALTSPIEHVSRYVVSSPGLAPVHLTIDWGKFPPEFKTADVIDHSIDRALRASKQWRQWSDIYCGSA